MLNFIPKPTTIESPQRASDALSRHLLSIVEQEKANLARELHDELGSHLMAIRINLTNMLEKTEATDPCLSNQIGETLQLLKKTMDIKHRIIEDLRPSMLDNFGLAVSIRSYCDDMAKRLNLPIDLSMKGDFAHIGPDRSIALYRIVQESLTNIVKYAQATRVIISLHQIKNGIYLSISDNGVGIASEVLNKPKTHGIFGMRERATLHGGTFKVTSNKDNHGTHITVFIPVPVVYHPRHPEYAVSD